MNKMMTMIKKVTATILAAATVMTATVAATPVNTYAMPLDYTLSHRADPNAPDVEINMARTFIGIRGAVDQYQIQPGKYYILMHPGKGKMPTFSFKLVKVLDSYEEDTWYGSERTIKVMNCDTGETSKVQPNKGFKPPHFIEVNDFLKK